MSEINLLNYIDWSMEYNADYFHKNIGELLERHLNANDVLAIYPKNLGLGTKGETYIFQKNKLLIASVDKLDKYLINIKYQEIIHFILREDLENNHNVVLEVYFNNLSPIILNNCLDTNNKYQDAFRSNILKIHRILMNF